MREWTDVDYAQAAIDMLAGEDIYLFLQQQGISGGSYPSRLVRWVTRWTDTNVVVASPTTVYLPTGFVHVP